MDADEREIFQFLKSWGGEFIAIREVSGVRAAGDVFTMNRNGPSRFCTAWWNAAFWNPIPRDSIASNPFPKRTRRVKRQKLGLAGHRQNFESGVEVEGSSEGGDVGPDEYYDEL